MKPKSRQFLPLALSGVVLGVVLLFHGLGRTFEGFDFFRRLEWMTFDWRVRHAANSPTQNATNLGFVFISNDSIDDLASGSLGYSAGLYWPRFVYGRVLDELKTQGAEAVAFDVLFPELRRDHTAMPDGTPGTPDENFAGALGNAGNAVLAAEASALPHDLFRTNAWSLGDITAARDPDGILRRARAFEDYIIWHPLVLRAARKLDGFRFDTNRVIHSPADASPVVMSIDPEGKFNQAVLYELLSAAEGRPLKFPAGVRPVTRAFTRQRVWDMGVMLAAYNLKLDLANARVEPGRRIVLRGAEGAERVIPIDRENRFYIDWSMTRDSPQLTRESFHSLLRQQLARSLGQTNEIQEHWRGKLAVIGSVASGNDLTDFGATPLDKGTFLTSRYWNIANSVLTGRFVRQSPLAVDFLIILGLGAIAGLVTWRLRALFAALAILLVAALYAVAAVQFYNHSRLWLPLVMPLGALVLTHAALVTYRAVFEQSEHRRIKSVFAKIVSPGVVNELLKAEKLSLGGARRPVSVLFADVRGFTELTDDSHARATDYIAAHNLAGPDAEAYFDTQAKELLATINLYLGAIADLVKKHDGTLDKYIGDCVMAFWGAPAANPRHALACVRAAIDAQRVVSELNHQRAAENKLREEENTRRAAAGQPPLPLLKLLSVGIGVNTGSVTVGLMGSEQHGLNYTILGRDVNLAQRLEAHSGRGRIYIGEATHAELLRDDPALAAACQALAPVQFKGLREAVRLYEVPWKPPQAATIPPPAANAA